MRKRPGPLVYVQINTLQLVSWNSGDNVNNTTPPTEESLSLSVDGGTVLTRGLLPYLIYENNLILITNYKRNACH